MGRIVSIAAARMLTPVTSEVTTTTVRRAGRILWGKVLDAGQTCIAPDYVLVPKELESLSMLSRKRRSTSRLDRRDTEITFL